jgi:hypothetical protein
MVEWWKRWRERAALRSYRTTLRAKLRELYGPARYYSPGRVKRAAEESGVNQVHIAYAYAMYCSVDRFHEGLEMSRLTDSARIPTFQETWHEALNADSSLTDWAHHGGDWHHSGHSFDAHHWDYEGGVGTDIGGGDGGGSDGPGR